MLNRRCGKSILLGQIKEEFIENGFDRTHIITINFEDLQFEKIRTAEKLNAYVNEQIKDHDKYLILKARDLFDIKPDDALIILGDEAERIAIMKADTLYEFKMKEIRREHGDTQKAV